MPPNRQSIERAGGEGAEGVFCPVKCPAVAVASRKIDAARLRAGCRGSRFVLINLIGTYAPLLLSGGSQHSII